MIPLIIIIIAAVIAIIIGVAAAKRPESGKRRAGRIGEEVAANEIRRILKPEDTLLTNVQIEIHGKEAELDCVVVNKFGVFIFEVKNYSGKIVGSEDDNEWDQYKTTSAGNKYYKKVRNPIPQVKRQIYVLKSYLSAHGARVWIEGFVVLLRGNCPVQNEFVVNSLEDADRVIHRSSRNNLSPAEIRKITALLQ